MRRKYSLIISILVIICLSPFIVCAQKQVSVIEAKNAAVNFINNRFANKNYSSKQIANVNTDSYKNNTLLYEIIFEDGQTVLLSGSKSTQPVLGVYRSNKSIFDIDDVPGGLKVFLNEYRAQVLHTFKNDTISMSYLEDWTDLQQEAPNKDVSSYVVYPLLSTKWGQNDSNDSDYIWINTYNFYVPEICPNDNTYHCPAGCVAVAMAQIMNYWKYPVYLQNQVNQYDWCNMPNAVYYSNNPNFETQRNAIAKLTRDCGIQVNMDYCRDGECKSSASNTSALNALVNYFNYDEDAILVERINYSDAIWSMVLKYNLNEGRPIYYSANDPETGGHAFVCDGYTSDGLFHFNWGWNGLPDGDFAISNLNPSDNYTLNHRAIFNIYPANTQDYCNYTLSLTSHYLAYYGTSGNENILPHENVPYTLTRLISVPNNSNYPASWRTIPAGGTSDYRAHEEIILQNGFYAEPGSNFYAHIIPCPSCGNMEASPEDNILQSESSSDTLPATKSLQKMEDNVLNGMTLYPNPTTGNINISFANGEENARQVVVSNLLGVAVIRQENPQGNTIDASPLTPGMYVVRVQTQSGNTYFGKFVKK